MGINKSAHSSKADIPWLNCGRLGPKRCRLAKHGNRQIAVDQCTRQLVLLGNSPNILRMKALKQVGALCVCGADDGALRVLLVTSRETGRWVIPKGWLAKGHREHKSAAREAMEEAGVSGRIWSEPIGSYRYFKRDDKADQLLGVSVFLLAVSKQKNHWPEQEQRRRAWFSVEVAARRVAEPELRALIRSISKLDIKPEWRVGTGSRA